MKELKVKVWNYKNVVLFEVLEMDESLREKKIIFEASNGYEIVSVYCPCLHSNDICIRGSQKQYDNTTSTLECENIEEAKETVKKVKQAVAEYNESIKEILTDKEKEYLGKFLEPYKVIWVKRLQQDINKEFIKIKVINEVDNIDFIIDLPFFYKETRYKGMKLGKAYTLKELGLEE